MLLQIAQVHPTVARFVTNISIDTSLLTYSVDAHRDTLAACVAYTQWGPSWSSSVIVGEAPTAEASVMLPRCYLLDVSFVVSLYYVLLLHFAVVVCGLSRSAVAIRVGRLCFFKG